MGRAATIGMVLVAAGGALGAGALELRRSDRAPTPPLASSAGPTRPAATRPSGPGAPMPVRFEQNVGQTDGVVRYLARAGRTTLFLTDDAATLAFHPHGPAPHAGDEASPPPSVVRMKVRGGRAVTPVAARPLVTRTSYFRGSDPSQWRTGVPSFGRITYRGVLAGVDLVYHSDEGHLEYDLVVAPGVDVGALAMEVEGAENLAITHAGELAVRTASGTLLQGRPRVLERDAGGDAREVEATYRLVSDTAVGFAVASYDRTRELVIDPVLAYSTYLGGTSTDSPSAIAVDASGNAYVAGTTFSADFPTQAALRPAKAGGRDVVVAKLNASGDALLYATFLGGGGSDEARDIAVDATGSAVVVGQTSSASFPTANALYATKSGGPGGHDAFVTRLTPSGDALVYSTYVGGDDTDIARSVALDAAGNAYVTGVTLSANFPTVSPFQAASASAATYDGFLMKLTPVGSTLVYSTYFGGSGWDGPVGVAVDASGSAYVTGMTSSPDLPTKNALQAAHAGTAPPFITDAFITKFTPSGGALAFSTYLGGSDGLESVAGIAVDASAHAYVIGRTATSDFPIPAVRPGAAGVAAPYIVKLSPTGASLDYGKYLGGGPCRIGGIAVAAGGTASFAITSNDHSFPVLAPIHPTPPWGRVTAGKLSPDGDTLLFSTNFGAGGEQMAEAAAGRYMTADAKGNLYLLGSTSSATLPTVDPLQATLAGDTDFFVAKIDVDAGDAGTTLPWTDAGPLDAGTDGGPAGDAGAPLVDASGVPAPAPDAAPAEPPTETVFVAGGGCDCRAAPLRAGSAGSAWPLAAFVAWALRRRVGATTTKAGATSRRHRPGRHSHPERRSQ